MSKVQENINKFKTDIENFGDGAPDIYTSDVIEILEALKLAEEALRTCKWKNYAFMADEQQFDTDKIKEALEAINNLEERKE